jgi:hypothetical protein
LWPHTKPDFGLQKSAHDRVEPESEGRFQKPAQVAVQFSAQNAGQKKGQAALEIGPRLRAPDLNPIPFATGQAWHGSKLLRKLIGKLVGKLLRKLFQELIRKLISELVQKLGSKLVQELLVKLISRLAGKLAKHFVSKLSSNFRLDLSLFLIRLPPPGQSPVCHPYGEIVSRANPDHYT